ncbi:MAG: tRNA 2-selenouridine(34) synthase MnmH [Bacteroidia bacterium]
MPITKLNIEEFLRLNIILDVRSPGEYEHAHIPEAISLPLFTNEERKVVGTAYKQESREKAIKIGLDYFGTKTVKIIETVEKIVSERKIAKEVGLHCWRGGMRSAAVAWLLDLYGFKVYLLTGGYKIYRHWVLEQFTKKYDLQILGGYTGSNKTGLVQELKKKKESVIDLEMLAGHKGSAFGNLDHLPQPSQEMFENLLAKELFSISFAKKNIWLEDESQRIGLINIPLPFYHNMRNSAVVFLNIPFEERLNHIIVDYGNFSKEKIINAIIRIKKKLGGLETKTAINFLLEDDVRNCFAVLLKYYDKLYLRNTYKRENAEKIITQIDLTTVDVNINSEKIIEHVNNR